jgi:integrase
MEKIKRKEGIRFREKIYINGREFKSPCFERKADASVWKSVKLAEKRQFLSTGVMPVMRPELVDMKFREFAEWWLVTKVKARSVERTGERYEMNLRHHIYPIVGDLLLSQVSREHADTLISNLRESNHNPTGTNLVVGVLKQIMKEAFKQEKVIKYPFSDFAKLKEKKREDTYMSNEEIEKILQLTKDLKDPLRYLYLVALNTGMRRGELSGLLWDRVNFEKEYIQITRHRDGKGLADKTKTRSSQRLVPMNSVVKTALMELKNLGLHPEYVFCSAYGKPVDPGHVYQVFRAAQKKAGITNHYRFHDLRHTFASHFMMNGGSLYDLQKLLGHARHEETQRYAHLAPEHLAKAIGIVNFGAEPDPTPAEQTAQPAVRPAAEEGPRHLRIVSPA